MPLKVRPAFAVPRRGASHSGTASRHTSKRVSWKDGYAPPPSPAAAPLPAAPPRDGSSGSDTSSDGGRGGEDVYEKRIGALETALEGLDQEGGELDVTPAVSGVKKFVTTPWKLALVVLPVFVFLVLYLTEPRWVCDTDPLSLKRTRAVKKVVAWTLLVSAVGVGSVWLSTRPRKGETLPLSNNEKSS